MQFSSPRGNPETKLYRDFKKLVESHGWYIKKTHGSKYQSGLPDVVMWHKTHGERWVELKTTDGALSTTQINSFANITKYGGRIWVVRKLDDYKNLFGKPNWTYYVPGVYSKYVRDSL